MPQKQSYLGEVLFEFVVRGNFVKVMAVDPITGTEVSIVGDSRASKNILQRVATKKLVMVLKRKRGEGILRNDGKKNNSNCNINWFSLCSWRWRVSVKPFTPEFRPIVVLTWRNQSIYGTSLRWHAFNHWILVNGYRFQRYYCNCLRPCRF